MQKWISMWEVSLLRLFKKSLSIIRPWIFTFHKSELVYYCYYYYYYYYYYYIKLWLLGSIIMWLFTDQFLDQEVRVWFLARPWYFSLLQNSPRYVWTNSLKAAAHAHWRKNPDLFFLAGEREIATWNNDSPTVKYQRPFRGRMSS